MASSDDEADAGPRSVSNYYFVDDEDAPTSFSVLPFDWSGSESVKEVEKQQIFLQGSVDNGLQTIHEEVKAWKFDLLNEIPLISVLTKENNWIKLEKPRKSFEEIIRTVLITVYCLHFTRRNPEASGKSVWDHLCRVFSLYEVRPSLNDLVDHMALISEAVKRDDWLGKSKFLLSLLEEKPKKRKLSDEDVKSTALSAFIVDDDILEDVVENESDEDEELFDSVCTFCDNGGNLLCCEGSCMRSFHPTFNDGVESKCESLGFTQREVDAIERFLCKNCEYNKHQCFACGELGSSDKSSGAEVFRCANATCGYFYHPHCIAKLVQQEDEVAVEELEKKVARGEPFTCPIHKCCICRKGENKKIKELQFAVCRRCPTSYHRKCLPKEIVFEKKEAAKGEGEEEEEEEEEGEEEEEEEEEEGEAARAWEDLLPNRILIYCLKHEIVENLGTPVRDIRFPDVEGKNKKRMLELPGSSGKVLAKKRRLTSEDSFSAKTAAKAPEHSYSGVRKFASVDKSEKILSGSNSLRKAKTNDAFRKSFKEKTKCNSTEVDRSATTTVNKMSLGDRLYSLMTKRSGQGKLQKQDEDKSVTVKTSARKLSSEIPALDAETEKRILALIKEAASSITLDDVKKKHEVPSTHAYSSKTVVDKTITAGRVEGTVEAVRTALRKLEDGCSTEDAKAVCEPEVLNQVFRWKNKLRVYLAPFLYGMRYTSFGRHFTKVEKLKEIVNVLHWYVQDGDMVVDFCCGANDFSCLMKKKLEETGKKCSYKNYDVFQPKNDFNFEKRDWMTVRPDELPKRGSQLIMGLNPPFGVKAALANKFIDKALEFKPKLLILIVPPETERLDKKHTPYDLVWEDDHFLSGKSFYLPGSVDENDKQMEQWNVIAPPLYLWSRPDWTVRHNAISKKHDHLSMRKGESDLVKSCLETKIPDHTVEIHCRNADTAEVTGDLSMEHKEKSNHEGPVVGGRKECSHKNGDRESQDSHGPERSRSKEETSRKIKHSEDKTSKGAVEKLPSNRWKGGTSPGSDMYKVMPHCSPTNVANGRSRQEVPPSRSVEMPMNGDVRENSLPNLESGMPSSRMPYGMACGGSASYIHEDVGRKYSMDSIEYSHGIHGFSHANMEEQSTGNMRESAESFSYRSYMTELERGPDMRSQIRAYGQDVDSSVQRNYLGGHEPGYGQMGSLSSIPYGHMGPAVESSYRMNMSAMQRYAPRLDELNHTRMNDFGPDPSMLNQNNALYDPRAPRPGVPGNHGDSMGFAPGPQHLYPHNSAGWLNE